MGWITVIEAYTKAGIGRATAYRHLKHLRKSEPEIYNKLVKKVGGIYYVLEPQMVAHFKTDTRRIKPAPKRVKRTKRMTKYYIPDTYIPEEIKQRAERLMAEPYIIEIAPDVKQLFNSIQSEVERDRILICVAICDEFVDGFYSLEKCCQHQGIQSRTFRWWRQRSAELSVLFKRAKKKRNKNIKEVEVDSYHATVRLLSQGFEREEITESFNVFEDITGKKFEIATGKKVTNKYVLPNLAAAMYGLNNRSPKKWKRFTPIEQLLLDANKKPDDELGSMTADELRAWLKKHDPQYGSYAGDK